MPRNVQIQTHFDKASNMIVMLHGVRRYILLHPNQCPNLDLYPAGHPSERHSSISNWNQPDLSLHPKFRNARGTELILQPGDALFVPTYWFHYITTISDSITYQCNTWSGIGGETTKSNYQDHIQPCGF